MQTQRLLDPSVEPGGRESEPKDGTLEPDSAAEELARNASETWQKVQQTIVASVETYNREYSFTLPLRILPGSFAYSLWVHGGYHLKAVSVRLDARTATILCTGTAASRNRGTFHVVTEGDSKSTGSLGKRSITMGQISQIILDDFVNPSLNRPA